MIEHPRGASLSMGGPLVINNFTIFDMLVS